jgi:putative transposase
MLGAQMDRTKVQVLAHSLAKDIKTEADLVEPSQKLFKLTVETALSAELIEHLDNEKRGDRRPTEDDARNGTTFKGWQSQHSDVEIETPYD